MITESDSTNTLDCGKYYVIIPSHPAWDKNAYIKKFKATFVPSGFKYNSGENTEWISVDELRAQIKNHVDPNFEVEVK
jgi:hypothetical protein